MQLQAQTRIAFPRDVVFRTYRDRIVPAVPYMPNVASIVEQERKVKDGGVIELVNLWTGKTEIPAVARKFLKAEMLTWTDYATWDEPTWICRWRLKTHALPEVLECSGQTVFTESGPGATTVELSGTLALHLEKASIPRFLAGTLSPLIERVLVGGVRPNLLSAGAAVEKLLLSGR
ncbi:MAG TPA: hypothetical protein VGK67_20815 [Myxococcales bacterium]|jgi:hypothetical protein